MARHSRNRRNRSREEEEMSDTEYFRNTLDELATNTISATFFIAVGSNRRDRNSFSHVFPIFFMREPFSDSDRIQDPTSFVSIFFKEYINTIKRKERLWQNLKRNQPFKFTKNMAVEECVICMENFKINQFLRKLDCDHIFHKRCVDKWLIQGNQCCPICRKEPFAKMSSGDDNKADLENGG